MFLSAICAKYHSVVYSGRSTPGTQTFASNAPNESSHSHFFIEQILMRVWSRSSDFHHAQLNNILCKCFLILFFLLISEPSWRALCSRDEANEDVKAIPSLLLPSSRWLRNKKVISTQVLCRKRSRYWCLHIWALALDEMCLQHWYPCHAWVQMHEDYEISRIMKILE
jgi:hypothetical protein